MLLFARYNGPQYTLVAINTSDADQTVPFWFPIGGNYLEELHGGNLNPFAASFALSRRTWPALPAAARFDARGAPSSENKRAGPRFSDEVTRENYRFGRCVPGFRAIASRSRRQSASNSLRANFSTRATLPLDVVSLCTDAAMSRIVR